VLVGPIFSREALIAPRQLSHYLIRSGYVAVLLVLIYTIRQVTIGFQEVTNVGDVARFGNFVFQVISIVQLALVLFFALIFAANSVAQEKDSQTLLMLLMTDLRDRELVLGKLCSSLMTVFVLILASTPVFFLLHRLGGVTAGQIGWSIALCAATALLAGSWGSLVAYWRESTFQTLSISVLGVVVLVGVVEGVVALTGGDSTVGAIVGLFNPFRAMFAVLSPMSVQTGGGVASVSAVGSVSALIGLATVLNVIAVYRLRAWNPSRSVFRKAQTETDKETGITRARTRPIWNNPVVWREIRTKAYGRKAALIKTVYCVLAVLAVSLIAGTGNKGELFLGKITPEGFLFVGLALVSLMLVNAQAVTALTSERDMKTLELLLMTDVTAKEFVFGKLGGIFYNAKEVILVPLLLMSYILFQGAVTFEDFVYVSFGFLVLVGFSAMLGLHSGFSYDSSRTAITNSLGTMFFLFVGIVIFMMLLIEARSSFYLQFQSFIVFIGMGSIGLYVSLSRKNPSMALRIAAAAMPFLTFYSITEYLLDGSLGVCVAVSGAYGFTTAAMLIPAISEFDVALGRTTLDQG
jgi:ABC-type Na+ efflux pump permease subunit